MIDLMRLPVADIQATIKEALSLWFRIFEDRLS